MSDLSIKATKGMFWSLAENFSVQAIQLVISIMLARLLLPEQYGLIGILSIFMAVAQTLSIGGLGSALIQKKGSSHLDECSVFYFNLFVGITMALLLIGMASLIARFYNEPLLRPLARVMALDVVINAFSLVPSSLLSKRLDFKPFFKVSLISVTVSGGISIILALNNWGVWSLAVQSITSSLIRAILFWQFSHWRPLEGFSLKSLKNMFFFSSRMLVAGLMEAIFPNLYQTLIGKMFTLADVGYYMRAQTMQAATIKSLGATLGKVMFPALSSIQDDFTRMNKIIRKAMSVTGFFLFPIIVGLIVIAEPLFILLMTERWAASIPYFQLFCIVGFFTILQAIHFSLLPATGRSNLFFWIEVSKKVLILIAIFLTFQKGITALLLGQIVASLVGYLIHCFFSKKLINYTYIQQLFDILPSLFISLMMGISIYLLGFVIDSLFIRLISQLLIGTIMYVLLNFIFIRQKLKEGISIVKALSHSITVTNE